jgi:hypothetical protein
MIGVEMLSQTDAAAAQAHNAKTLYGFWIHDLARFSLISDAWTPTGWCVICNIMFWNAGCFPVRPHPLA